MIWYIIYGHVYSFCRDGDYEFSVMCAAHGKPKPSIRWLKGDKEVSSQLFDTVTDESESKYYTAEFLF